MTMHICYFLQAFPRVSETFISDEIYNILKLGNKATIITLQDIHTPVIHKNAEYVLKHCETIKLRPINRAIVAFYILKLILRNPISTIKIILKIKCLGYPFWISAQLTQAISKLKNKIDHIHVHFADTQVLFAQSLAIWLGTKFSFTIHGYDIREFPIGQEALRQVSNSASKIISYSKSNIDDLAKIGISQSNMAIIPCGVDANLFNLRQNQYEGGPLNIVCVARLHKIKCQHIIIRAIKSLIVQNIEVKLTLVGDGDLRESLEKLVDELNITHNVSFAGACEQSEVIQHLQSAHIHIIASRHEGLGLSNLEAMAMGLAVIATEVGGLAEVINHESNGLLVAPDDSEELANAIKRFYNNPELWKRLSRNAREYCIQNHSRDIQIQKFVTEISSNKR